MVKYSGIGAEAHGHAAFLNFFQIGNAIHHNAPHPVLEHLATAKNLCPGNIWRGKAVITRKSFFRLHHRPGNVFRFFRAADGCIEGFSHFQTALGNVLVLESGPPA